MMFFRRLSAVRNVQMLRCYTSIKQHPIKDTTPAGGAAPPASLEVKQSPVSTSAQQTPKELPSFSHLGDNGTTNCLAGEQLPKDHRIFNAIGATEELLSYIGLTREHAIDAEHDYIHKLIRIQTVLIDISTAISHSNGQRDKNAALSHALPVVHTKELEEWINEYSKQLPPVELYIIPGGGIASASLHVARSLCRRTERYVVPLVRDGGLDKEVQVYLNRLADFLLTLSRIAAKLDNRTESIYTPKANEQFQAQ